MKAAIPKPLPKRRRALSVPRKRKPLTGLGALSRLPFEIRYMIYVYVLGDEVIHLDHIYGRPRIAHFRCEWTKAPEHLKAQSPYHSHNQHFTPDGKAGNGKMALLKSCRAIYVEASQVLYTTNTFAVYGVGNWETFLFFSKSIRPQRLASIADLYINTQVECFEPMWDMVKVSKFPQFNQEWKQMWDIISSDMVGLRILTVHVKRTYKPLLVLTLEAAWVKPMLQVRDLKRFRFEMTGSENMPDWNDDYKKQVQRLKVYLQTKLSVESSGKPGNAFGAIERGGLGTDVELG